MPIVPPLATRKLHAHPSTPCANVDDVIAEVAVAPGRMLVVRYTIVGELDRLQIPARSASLDPDRLWAHTCCELFVAPATGEGYVEWNFSPSGQVARFAFQAYRSRSPTPSTSTVDSAVTVQDRELRLEARVPVPPDVGESARIALSAVIEDSTGALSFWALRHPSDRPDFHHPEGFALALTLGPSIAIV